MDLNFESEVFLINAIVGCSLLLVALFSRLIPPKKINSLYGYRTSRSMKNQANWNLAQEYSNLLLLRYSVYLILLSILGLFTQFSERTAVIISVAAIALVCFGLYRKTENQLKAFEDYEKDHSDS